MQAVAFDGADVDTLDLVRHLDAVDGDDLIDLRTRIKSRIRNLISEMIVKVDNDGPVRRATVMLGIRPGLERRILIMVPAPGNPSNLDFQAVRDTR